MSGLPKAAGLPGEPMILSLAEINTSPIVYEPIANTGDYTGPASAYTVTDVSSHGNRARRKITTLLDSGTFAFPLWFIPGGAASSAYQPSHMSAADGLQAIFERGDLRAWKLSTMDDVGTAYFFNAYISKFSKKMPIAGVLSADIELTIDNVILTGTDTGGIATAVFAPAE